MSLIKFTLYYKQNLEKIPKAIWKDQWRSKLLIQDSCKARYIFSSEKILFWLNFQPQRRHLRFLWRGTKNVVKQHLSRHFLLKNSYKSVKKIHPIITFNCKVCGLYQTLIILSNVFLSLLQLKVPLIYILIRFWKTNKMLRNVSYDFFVKKKPNVKVLLCEKTFSSSVFLKLSYHINGMLCRLS